MSNYNNSCKTTMFSHVQVILILLLLVTILVTVVSEQDTVFLNCLEKQPTSYPTAETSYTKHNSSFQSVYSALVRNRRFLNPVYQKPLVIVTAKDVSDVQATLFCCKRHGVQLRIRGGGHDMEGTSYIAGAGVPFVILDMLNMRSIKINIEEETATIQAGAVLGEVYYAVAQKSRVHAFPGGVCPTVGVTGHFSGGGYGNLMREYGLSTDHVVDALLVDVDGKVLNRTSMGEDRFWAIRGGGAASFGIVLAWKVMLVRVPPLVTVFRLTRSLEQGAPETMYRWQEIAPNLPKKIFIRVRVSVLKAGELKFYFIGLFLGSTHELIELLNEKFPEMGLSAKECTEMPWVNSTLFWADAPAETPTQFLISRQDEKVSRKVKSDFVVEPIPKQGIEKICKAMINMEGLVMEWNPYGGRMSEIPWNEIAYSHRAGILFKIEYDFKWYETGIEVDKYHVEQSRSFYKFMTPYVSKSPRMAYFNYRDFDMGVNHGKQDTNITASFGMSYYGNNFMRLVKVKTETDPTNFFRYEQSIPLAPTTVS